MVIVVVVVVVVVVDDDNNIDDDCVCVGVCKLNGRFGWSVVLLDFNADGQQDLVVGAPSDDSSQLSYHGAVYVYLAQRGHTLYSTQRRHTLHREIIYTD